jgi:glycosyltransferase involved in cell wall biosynthesis
VVCSRDDREEVLALNRSAGTGGGGATVLVDIAHDRARELLFSVDSGSAVVASSVRGLDGYVQDGVNAVLVGPGEPGALGAAVDRLLSDVALRARLARAAFARAEAWTWDEYLQAVQALAEGRPLAVPPQF